MSKQISLTLPDELLRQAEVIAERSGREVADILAEAIEVSLDPPGPADVNPLQTSSWSDEQVLAATDAAMPPAEDRRLSELLDQQQAGRLTQDEGTELTCLLQMFQQGLLHQARGLAEAVSRGLRDVPLP